MAGEDTPDPARYPVGFVGGAREFIDSFPEEMAELGALTAYWAYVEHTFCRVFGAILENDEQAEAIFYASTNHKARRDMVTVAAKHKQMSDEARRYLDVALAALKEAADARNALLHGLILNPVGTDELVSEVRRPVTKVPLRTKQNLLMEIRWAHEKCDIAENLLSEAATRIRWPNWPDDFMKRMRNKRGKPGG